jgi:uncharacterized protein YndB with AHSA1/START domain
MKAVKIIAIVFGVLLLAVIGAHLAQPGQITVTREAEIGAPIEQVFATAADLQTWGKWTSWSKKDPGMTYTYSGTPANQVGSWQAWQGKDGNGKLTYTEIKPNEMLAYNMEFEGFKPSQGGLSFVPAGDKTKVSWTMTADMGWFRAMGFMFTSAMKEDFDQGLAGLDAYVQTLPKPAPSDSSPTEELPKVKLEVQ